MLGNGVNSPLRTQKQEALKKKKMFLTLSHLEGWQPN